MINDNISMQSPNPKLIKCATCKHRDKTFIQLGEKKKYIGITKDICSVYTGETIDKLKPSSVLFDNSKCIYYELDTKE